MISLAKETLFPLISPGCSCAGVSEKILKNSIYSRTPISYCATLPSHSSAGDTSHLEWWFLAEAERFGNLEWVIEDCVEPCQCVAGLWDSLHEKQWWKLLVRTGTVCIIISPWTAMAWSEFCFCFSGDSNLAVITPVLSAKRLFTVCLSKFRKLESQHLTETTANGLLGLQLDCP